MGTRLFFTLCFVGFLALTSHAEEDAGGPLKADSGENRLRDGHHMQTTAQLNRAPPYLVTGEVHIWSNNNALGFHGIALLIFTDEKSNIIHQDASPRVGVSPKLPLLDAERNLRFDFKVPEDVARRTHKLEIINLLKMPSSADVEREVKDRGIIPTPEQIERLVTILAPFFGIAAAAGS
jgi:hypothetical protein